MKQEVSNSTSLLLFDHVIFGTWLVIVTISTFLVHLVAVKSSEVFRSVLRPIIRVTYEQFNEAMTNKALALTKYPEGWVNDLEVIGKAASALMKNREESDKRQRDSGRLKIKRKETI